MSFPSQVNILSVCESPLELARQLTHIELVSTHTHTHTHAHAHACTRTHIHPMLHALHAAHEGREWFSPTTHTHTHLIPHLSLCVQERINNVGPEEFIQTFVKSPEESEVIASGSEAIVIFA